MRIIESNGATVAVLIPKNTEVSGIRFVTPNDYPLQIGLIQHPNDKKVPAHIHRFLEQTVKSAQEFIYVIEGNNVEVTLFTNEWDVIEELVLGAGDAILLVSGGHSLNIPKDCKLIEVKQGPYPGDESAKIFRDPK